MPIQVLVPKLGESVDEVSITKWLKAKGEAVKEYEPLLEVNTDKVDTEIPSPATGILLDILIPEGKPAKVGAVLALIGQPGETLLAAAAAASASHAPGPQLPGSLSPQPPASADPPLTSGRSRELGFISPVVAKLTQEYGIDLAQVPGTGMGGRITKKDILTYVESHKTAPAPLPTISSIPLPSSPAASPAPLLPASSSPLPSSQAGAEHRVIPLTNIRRAIADHMVQSIHTSPHVLTVMEADLSKVVAHREANKAAFAHDGANLTFTAYFVAAIVAGLKAYPLVNSSWSGAGIVVHSAINIGMATSLSEEGLIVPVIKHADNLSLLGVARSVNDFASRARAKKLQPDEVKGGTFTLTNHGVSGSLFAMPIINQPQCGILGVGAIQKRAVVLSDEKLGDVIAIRPMVYLSFVFDHRILDGASADWFLAKVVESLENWR